MSSDLTKSVSKRFQRRSHFISLSYSNAPWLCQWRLLHYIYGWVCLHLSSFHHFSFSSNLLSLLICPCWIFSKLVYVFLPKCNLESAKNGSIFMTSTSLYSHSLQPPKSGWGCLCPPPVLNLRAVIWFPFPISCFFLPSPFALSVLSFFC